MPRSTFRSQNVESTSRSEHFWKLRCRKSARRCGAKHISTSKCKTPHARTTFEGSDVVSHGRRKGFCTLPKVSQKTLGYCRISKTMAGVGHLKRMWKDACHMAGAVQETCSSEMLGGQGADFLRRAAFWSIRSSRLLR